MYYIVQNMEKNLHIECNKGNLQKVVKLLNEGAKINEVNDHGWTALHIAVEKNNVKLVETLLERGADPHISINKSLSSWYSANVIFIRSYYFNGWTPLHLAASINSALIVEILLKNHANINGVNNDGHTPLDLAIIYNSSKTFSPLIESIEDINAPYIRGYTLLTIGCSQNYLKLVSCVLAHGASIKSNNLKFLSLHKAVLLPLIMEILHNKYDPILAEHDKKISELNNMLNKESDFYFTAITPFIVFDSYKEILNISRPQMGGEFCFNAPSLFYLCLKSILPHIKEVLEQECQKQFKKAQTAELIINHDPINNAVENGIFEEVSLCGQNDSNNSRDESNLI